MCGRYARRSDKQKIAEVFHAAVGDLSDLNFAPDDDIRPTTIQPIIRANRDSGDRELVGARWGFVPSWQKPDEKFPPTAFNARAEGIEKAGMWRNAFARHRCLVPADSFFEWHKIRPKNNPKYEIGMADGRPFAFAGAVGRMEESDHRRVAPELHHHHDRPQRADGEDSHSNAGDSAREGL